MDAAAPPNMIEGGKRVSNYLHTPFPARMKGATAGGCLPRGFPAVQICSLRSDNQCSMNDAN